MIQHLPVNDFLNASEKEVILDVRSPSEYIHGHIPGAISFPLFEDMERAEVGTLYKKAGKQAAVIKGLEIVGPKLKGFAEKAIELSDGNPLRIHCWRGGMRSSSMAMLLQAAGLECHLLKGGYKAYRNHLLSEFGKPWKFVVLGGKTGSGKTQVLHELSRFHAQVIDLEALAHHKGSAFGRIGELPQPTTEQFGNDLFHVLQHFDINKPIWIEDESHMIGNISIPVEFYANYRRSSLLVLDIPFEERLDHLVKIYGDSDLSAIKEAFVKIKKKLGGQHVITAMELLEAGDLKQAAAIALKYYDKAYGYGLEHKDTPNIKYIPFDTITPQDIAIQLLKYYE